MKVRAVNDQQRAAHQVDVEKTLPAVFYSLAWQSSDQDSQLNLT